MRARKVTPHIAINGSVSKIGKVRKTAMAKRTTHHPGYGISLRCRKRVEKVFSRIKAQAGFAKVKVRGRPKVAAVFGFAIAAYNLVRLQKLLAAAAAQSLEFVREKWNPVFPKRQTKTNKSRVCLVRFEPDRL